MDFHYLTYSLDILILFALPISLGIFLVRKYYLDGRIWWIGAAVYILTLVGRLPLEGYVINPFLNNLSESGALPSSETLIVAALILGMSTALWEELFRYTMFRWWAKGARSWLDGLLAGTGHGGTAAIILGCLVLYNFVNMATVRNMDISTLVTADQLPVVQAQISAFWSAPWYSTFHEAIEQLITITVQISLAVLVLQTFIRRQWYWVLIAFGYHTLFEATYIVSQNLLSGSLYNVPISFFAVASLIIIITLQRPKPAPDLSASMPV